MWIHVTTKKIGRAILGIDVKASDSGGDLVARVTFNCPDWIEEQNGINH